MRLLNLVLIMTMMLGTAACAFDYPPGTTVHPDGAIELPGSFGVRAYVMEKDGEPGKVFAGPAVNNSGSSRLTGTRLVYGAPSLPQIGVPPGMRREGIYTFTPAVLRYRPTAMVHTRTENSAYGSIYGVGITTWINIFTDGIEYRIQAEKDLDVPWGTSEDVWLSFPTVDRTITFKFGGLIVCVSTIKGIPKGPVTIELRNVKKINWIGTNGLPLYRWTEIGLAPVNPTPPTGQLPPPMIRAPG